MPRGDGTGSAGLGSMTGRGAGYCTGFSAPGYANPVGFRGGFGRGFGGGFGRGRRFRNGYYTTGVPGWVRYGYDAMAGVNTTSSDEKVLLNNQAKFLENQLEQIKSRLSSLNEET